MAAPQSETSDFFVQSAKLFFDRSSLNKSWHFYLDKSKNPFFWKDREICQFPPETFKSFVKLIFTELF